jgi:hypothetical protein
MNKLLDIDDAYGAIKLDGFDDCIVGITEEFGGGIRLLYSRDKILESLQKDMSEEDAIEYYYYNIVGGYFGEQNPIFLI